MLLGDFNQRKCIEINTPYVTYELDNKKIFFIGHLYNQQYNNIAKQLLEGYIHRGYDSFTNLDGCFTIIIYTNNEIIIVRDRHGLHAQIYYTKELFCSSLYKLVNIKCVNKEPDYSSLAFFMTAGHIKNPRSSFKNISKLNAGHILVCDKENGISTIDIFSSEKVIPKIDKSKGLEDYSEEFYKLHKQAISRRMLAGNKKGIFLSGGYDSGANLIALRELYSGDIYSYSIGFKGSNISELSQAKLMAQTFGTIHKEYELDGSEISALPQIIRHLGDPFAECGMMVNHAVFGLSGQNFDGVLFGGEGNDHYFSSSNRQIAINYLANKFKLIKPLSALKRFLDQDMFDRDGIMYRTNFHLENTLNIIQGEIFGFPRWQVPKFLNTPSQLSPQSLIKPNSHNYDSLYLQHVLLTDIEKSLNQIILFKSSKIAQMYNSHIVYPFVDLDIYHFMNNLPNEYKCKGDSLLAIAMGKGVPKYLHKYLYAPKMPQLIAQKEKQGGFVPMMIFFQDAKNRKRLSEIILDSSICNQFLNKCEIEKFIAKFNKESQEPVKWFWYRQIKCNQFFNLLSLAIWWEEFIENRHISF